MVLWNINERRVPWTSEGQMCKGMPGQGRRVGGLVSRGSGEGVGGGCFSEGKPGKWITFEM